MTFRLSFSTAARAAVLAAAASLAACDPAPETAETPAVDDALIAPPIELADVDLRQPVRVLGTEPFWAVDITPEEVRFTGVDRPTEQADNPGPILRGQTAVYEGATDRERDFSLMLAATPCSDGMSDRTYPLTARLELGDEVLTGCAASVDWLETTSETGEPAAAPPA